MRSVRTLFILGSSLGLVTMLACKKPEPTPEPPPPVIVKTEPTPTEVKTPTVDSTNPADMSAAKYAEFQKAASLALKDINFDFDRSDIRDVDKPKLQAIASFMKSFGSARVMIEGHCDERGTVEYNLALGERRAVTAQNYLAGLGVNRDRLGTISYGKEKPKVMGQNEESYLINRRDEFKLQN
ncbi:MAG: OmpA family protein [Holophagaceae bacterium]|nr:OmpA family protein [Holophagaceae bacterium]